MAIVTLGIRLAKNVFALDGMAEAGHVEPRKPHASGDVDMTGCR